MHAILIEPSYAELVDLSGDPVWVTADDGSTLSLWLECVSTPVHFDGHSSFSVRLTGPAVVPLRPGDRVLHSRIGDFTLALEPIGKDLRYLHYEAFRIESGLA